MRLGSLDGQQWMRTPAASCSDQYLLFSVTGLVILRVIQVYLLQPSPRKMRWGMSLHVIICLLYIFGVAFVEIDPNVFSKDLKL